jgi:hypothetical protein
MIQNNFFDLEQILVNELVGDLTLFIVLALIVIFLVCIANKIPLQGMLILMGLFFGIMFATYFEAVLVFWVFTIIFIGLMLYYAIGKAWK